MFQIVAYAVNWIGENRLARQKAPDNILHETKYHDGHYN